MVAAGEAMEAPMIVAKVRVILFGLSVITIAQVNIKHIVHATLLHSLGFDHERPPYRYIDGHLVQPLLV